MYNHHTFPSRVSTIYRSKNKKHKYSTRLRLYYCYPFRKIILKETTQPRLPLYSGGRTAAYCLQTGWIIMFIRPRLTI